MATGLQFAWEALEENVKRRRFKKRAPLWLYPLNAEIQYKNLLYDHINLLGKGIRQLLNNPFISSGANNLNKDADWTDELFRDLENLSNVFNPGDINRQLLEIFDKTDERNKGEWGKFQQSMVGIKFYGSEEWIEPFTKMWIGRNTTLIKTLTSDIVKRVEIEITNGVMSGKSVRTISKELYEDGGILKGSKSRARLIARDQVSKLNGNMTKKRQEDGGLSLYTWRDASDERVRTTHLARDGKVYEWDEPPSNTGHPGSDYQCRCYGEPVMLFDLSKTQKNNLVGMDRTELSDAA